MYEYRKLVIPLGFTLSENERVEVYKRVEQAVESALVQVRQEGWEADEPVDFYSLRSDGRLRRRRASVYTLAEILAIVFSSIAGAEAKDTAYPRSARWKYENVTISLRRTVD